NASASPRQSVSRLRWGVAMLPPRSQDVSRSTQSSGGSMTEAEWLACDDPERMRDLFYGKTTRRKRLLIGCAHCRLMLADNPGPLHGFLALIEEVEADADDDAAFERGRAPRGLPPEQEGLSSGVLQRLSGKATKRRELWGEAVDWLEMGWVKAARGGVRS